MKKKELKDRQFTPYVISITIDDESEHNALVEEIKELENLNRSAFGHFQTIKGMLRLSGKTPIADLIEIIKKHVK